MIFQCIDTHAVVTMEGTEVFAHQFLKEFTQIDSNTQVVRHTRQHKASKALLDVMEVTMYEVESVLKVFNYMTSDAISGVMYVMSNLTHLISPLILFIGII